MNNFKVPQKNSNDFDIVLEALRCLQVLLRLPDKFIDLKEKEKVLVVVSKYLKANSPFIAIEAAKVRLTIIVKYRIYVLGIRGLLWKCSSN